MPRRTEAETRAELRKLARVTVDPGSEEVAAGTLLRESGADLARSTAKKYCTRLATDWPDSGEDGQVCSVFRGPATQDALDHIAEPRADCLGHAALASALDVSERTIRRLRRVLWDIHPRGELSAYEINALTDGEYDHLHAERKAITDGMKTYRYRVTNPNPTPPRREPKTLAEYRDECAHLRRRVALLEEEKAVLQNREDHLRKQDHYKLKLSAVRIFAMMLSPDELDEVEDDLREAGIDLYDEDAKLSGEIQNARFDFEPRWPAPVFAVDLARVLVEVRKRHESNRTSYRNKFKRDRFGLSSAAKLPTEEDGVAMEEWVAEQMELQPWPEHLGRQ